MGASSARFISRYGFPTDLQIILLFGPPSLHIFATGAAIMDDREYAEVLRQVMTELTEQFAHPTETGDTLQSVTASSVDLIDGVECADVLPISGADLFRSVAATSQLAVDIDDLQLRFREGPCLDAAVGNPSVLCNDLREDPRWPRFAKAAVAAGVHSLLSFQLFTHNARMGALNLFGLKPGVFTVEREAVGAMLATHAAIALIADDVRLQFQSALASRDIIGQAKGMIMERFNVDAVCAFELLTRVSQNSNIRVAEVAEEIVSRGSEPKPLKKYKPPTS
jgi:transcriptional regulator with GAF, ATPase, and Fis domain